MTVSHGTTPTRNTRSSALQSFARTADGHFTERSLKEYLVLITVFETCEFNNVNVLKFLFSKETTLEGLYAMAGLRAKSKSTQVRSEDVVEDSGLR